MGNSVNDYNGKHGSALAYGVVPSYLGFYNYYNIGAYEDTTDLKVLQHGARYAARLVNEDKVPVAWTSERLAIIEGAKWIATEYVNKGQDTMYLNKFDLVGKPYTNQYVQNIEAACDESEEYFITYNELGLLDTAFNFRIPIFDSMPDVSFIKPF